jgi:hypothetical protein
MSNVIRFRLGSIKTWGWEIMGAKKINPQQRITNVAFHTATIIDGATQETTPAIVVVSETKGDVLNVILSSNGHNTARVQIDTAKGKFRAKRIAGNDFICKVTFGIEDIV